MSARAPALVAWLAFLALCALVVARTAFVADLSSFLPASPTAEQRVLVQQLRDGALSRVMLVGIEGADAPTRATISRSLAAAIAPDARFSAVANGDATGFERDRELLFAHRYVLSPQVNAHHFEVDGLREAIGRTLRLLASSAGLAIKGLVPRDPTGELVAILERLQPAATPAMTEGVWSSADGERAVMLVRTRASGADIDAQAEALSALERVFGAARQAAGPAASSARLIVTGPGVFSVRARELIHRDVVRLSTLSGALVLVLLLAAYRSPRLLLLGFVPVATGALAGIAAVSLAFGTVHGITLGFGTTLIGEAVDYAIYYFVQQTGRSEGRDNGDFWRTIRLGVLTSIAGFLALVFCGLPGLAQLGVYSIAGIVTAALVTRFVLPALAPRQLHVRDLSASGMRIMAFARRLARARVAVAIIALAAIAVIAWQGGRIWDRELESLNPITAADRENDRMLRAALAASDARVMIAIPSADLEGALERAERVGSLLDARVASGALGGYDSPARLVPSERMQRARQASLPEAAILRTRLSEALTGSPLAPAKLAPFIEDVERARASARVTPATWQGSALGTVLDGTLLRDGTGGWIAMLSLQPVPGTVIQSGALRAMLDAGGVPGALVLDVREQLDTLYSGYFRRALLASAGGLAAIVVLLAFALRSVERVLRAMVPFAAGVLVAAALPLAFGTALTLFHLVGLLLVAAIGSNYALFFERLAHFDPQARARTVASLVLANATTVIGFGVLSFSSIPVLHAIGSTVAIGAFATLVFSALCAREQALRA